MSQRVEWEVRLDHAPFLLNEDLPHAAARGVVWEGEVDTSVEELLEILFTAFVDFVRTSNNCDARIFVNPLLTPLYQSFLNSLGVVHLIAPLDAHWATFASPLLLLFLRRPDLLYFIEVDDGGLERFRSLENHRD